MKLINLRKLISNQVMKPFLLILLFMMQSTFVYADKLSDANTIFDWAESALPDYFSPSGTSTLESPDILMRHYKSSNTFIAVINNRVFVAGGIFGDEVTDVAGTQQLLDIITPSQAETPNPEPKPVTEPAVVDKTLQGTYDYQNQSYTLNNDCETGLSLLGISQYYLRPNSGEIRINSHTDNYISLDVKGNGMMLGIGGQWVTFTGTVSGDKFTSSYSQILTEAGESVDLSGTLTGTINSANSFNGLIQFTIKYNGYGYNLNCQLGSDYEAEK